ncbi:MAG: M10 family metallopeptidase C-terminal domain-containing protein [Planctomycetota bacterium]
MPSAPVVTVVTKYLLLNQLVSAADLFSVSDPDGDTITRYRFTDLSTDALSGYFQLSGDRRTQGVQSEITSAQLSSFEFVAASTIGTEKIRIQAYDGALWSNPVELQVIYFRENTTKPVVTANALKMVESDYVNVSSFISATDPDGWPITSYYLRDQSTTGGFLKLGSTVIPQGVYRYYTPAELANLRYYAVTPNQVERIEVFAYDGVNWSDYSFADVTTTPNFSRPTTNYASKNVADSTAYPIVSYMGWFDSDGNQIKSVDVFDTDLSPSSGRLSFNGNILAAGTWHTIPIEDAGGLFYISPSTAQEETIRYRVSDGKFTSTESNIDFRVSGRPRVAFDPIRNESDLRDLRATDLFRKGDNGPNFTTWQIQDLNGSTTASARLILDGQILNANVVHTLTAAQFSRLFVRTAQYQDRALDPILVRAKNPSFWSSWGRMELRTEPELSGMLRSGQAAPDPDEDGFNDWGDWLFTATGARSKVITYSFMQQQPGYDIDPEFPGDNNDDIPGSLIWGDGGTFSRFTADLRTATRNILSDVGSRLDVTFLEVPDSSFGPDPANYIYGGQGGVLRFGLFRDEPVEGEPPATLIALGPNDPIEEPSGGDIVLNNYWLDSEFPNWLNLSSWAQDTELYGIMLGAIGTTLGLGNPDGVPRLPQATNNGENTIYGLPGARIPGDYMIYDTYALESLYGPNKETRLGDTLYDWDYFGNKTGLLRTLFDAGGIDTLSAAGMQASQIDLTPGSFSNLGGTTTVTAEVRLSIPLENTLIENAIGSAFADTLTGNHLPNQISGGLERDTITGKGGNDLLMGGAGNDLYIYRLGDGDDTVREDGLGGRDTLRFDSSGTLDNFSQDFRFRREGRDLIISLSLDNSDLVDGTVRITNQQWGGWGIEILRFGPLGGTIQNIDLTDIYAQSTTVNQRFKVLSDTSKFGNLVAPV